MSQPDRTRLHRLIALYALLIVAWFGLARWVVPRLLVAERPGPFFAALKRYIQGFGTAFTGLDLLGRWVEFSVAVGIAASLHLTILLILRRYDLWAAEGRSPADVRAGRRVSLALSFLALSFLALTVLTWPRHDYYFFLQMWYEVRQGHDPWWIVVGQFGEGPLNAYGPAFNLLAFLPWLNPLAPKLLFAYGYIVFSIAQIKGATASHRPSGLALLGLFALFWNPFPWVEIASRGHFDILVGLCCLAAIRARLQRRDVLSGGWLALGVLLKYLPIVLLPFLARECGRLRLRVLLAGAASIAFGLALSCSVWGLSTLRPLAFANNRPSTPLSIFRFFQNLYVPIIRLRIITNIDFLSPVIMLLAVLVVWSWARARRPELEVTAAIVTATTVLLYRVGFVQYQMVPFVLASSWAVRHWRQLRGRTFLGIAIGCHVAWLAAVDVCDSLAVDTPSGRFWQQKQDLACLPTFLIGCLFVSGMVRSSTSEDDGAG